jgi:predicted phage tail protein
MEQVRDIYLYGRLGKKYGKHHRIAVRSPAECLRALSILLGAEEDLKQGDYRFVVGEKKAGISIDNQDICRLGFGANKPFHLVPNPRGAGFDPLTWAIIAIVGLTAATILLRPNIKTPTANDRQDQKTSFVFDGPVNVTEQGQPVPLVYGQVRTGSVVASAGIETTEVTEVILGQPNGGGTGGIAPGFSPGGSINRDAGAIVVANKGGKGGGGSARVAQEDPNSLQSQATARIVEIIAEGEIVGLVDGMKSIYLDDTPLQNTDNTFNFKGVAIETRVGLPTQTYMPGFAQQEATAELAVVVTTDNPITRAITNPLANRARVTLRLNALSRQDTTNGDLLRTTVTAAVDLINGVGSPTTVVTHEFNGKTTSPYQRSFDINIPTSGGPYSVRVRRITPDATTASVNDLIYFDLLTEIVDAKLTYPDTAVVGITIDAKQFGSNIPTRGYEVKGRIIQVPSNYEPTTAVYTGTWDGTFKLAYSNNPAWVFRDICVNPRFGLGRRVTEDKIDKFTLYQIAQYCDQLVDNGSGGQERRYTINTTISDREVAYNVLQGIASNFRAMVFMSSGQVVLTQDQPQSPVKIVTPSNVSEEGFDYDDESLDNIYSAFVVSWNNPADGYRLNYEVVEDPVLVQQLGWKVKDLAAFGTTSQGQARRIGLWALEDQQFAASRVRYRTGFDHADIQPGRVIQIADPDNTVSRRGGRVRSATTTVLTLDTPLTLDPATGFQVQVILPDGTIATRSITNGAGVHSTLTVTAALPIAPLPGSVFAVSSSSASPRQYRVMGLKEVENGEFEITAVTNDPGKFTRVESGVVIAPIPFTDIPTGPLIAPRSIQIREFLKQVGTASVPAILFSWTPADDPRVVGFQAQVRRPGASEFSPVYDGPAVSVDIDNVVGGTWTFRVRSVDGLGRTSAYRQLEQVVGGVGVDPNDPNNPGGFSDRIPEVTNFRAVLSDRLNQPYLEWTPPANDPRPFVYEVWYSPDLTEQGTFARARRVEVTSSTRGRIIDIGRYWLRTTFVQRVSPNPPVLDVGTELVPQFDYSTIINRPRTLAELDPGTKASFDNIVAVTNSLLNNDAEKSTQITNLSNEILSARGGGETLTARLQRIETTQVTGTGSTSANITSLEAEIQNARGGQPTLSARLGAIDIAVASGSTVQAQRIAVLEAGIFRGAGNVNLLPNSLYESGVTGIEQWRSITAGTAAGFTFARAGAIGDRTIALSWTSATISDRLLNSVGSVANAASLAPVIPGRRYGAGVRLRAKSGTGFSVSPTIRWLKSDFTNSVEYFPASPGTIGSTPAEVSTISGAAWTTAVAPADAAYALIEVLAYKQNQADTAAGTINFDNSIICEIDPQSNTAPPFNSNNFARVATIDNAIFTPGTGLASRLTTLETTVLSSDVGTLTARIAAEEIARATEDTALATRAGVLEASVRFSEDGVNRNPTFNGSWTSGTLPNEWSDWFNGTSNTRVTGQFSPYAVQFDAPVGANRGISQGVPNLAPYAQGYYVLEADVTLVSGSLLGAGLRVNVSNNNGAQQEDGLLNFGTDVDVNGAVVGAGTAGRTYRFRKLVQLTSATAQGFAFYAKANWDTFNASRPAKVIVFHRARLRTATDSEIELRQARAGALSVGARIANEEAARASADTAIATRATNLEAQMNNTQTSGLQSRIANEETARVTATDALATRTSTLESQMSDSTGSGLASRIADETTARTTAINTQASRTNVLESSVTAGSDSLNRNPVFGGSWSTGQIPTNWGDWVAGTNNANVTGVYSLNAVRFDTILGTDRGILQTTVAGQLPAYAAGWYVLEADVTLLSGSLVGAGIFAEVYNSTTMQERQSINFSTEPESGNTAPGSGTANRLYKFRKLVQFTYAGGFTDFRLYAAGSSSVFDATRPVKSIVFHRVVLRAATDQEVELRLARGAAGTLTARISTAESTTAGVDGKLTASYGLTVDAGGRIASMKLLSNGTTSSVAFTASSFQIFNGIGNTAPFEVIGNQVRIISAAIGAVSVGSLTAGTLTQNMQVGSGGKIFVDGANNRIVIFD